MRYQLPEYKSVEVDNTPLNSLKKEDIRKIIKAANLQIKSVLGWDGANDALLYSNGIIRAMGIAGIIKLTPKIELEIVPRHFSRLSGDWKESLFFLSIISRHGGSLVQNALSGSTLQRATLYDLCGIVIINEFYSLQRSLIRSYQHYYFNDYSIEGDIVFDSIYENYDGYLQELVVFNKSNRVNATIQKAMSIVLPYVSIPTIKNQLELAISKFGLQPTLITNRRENIPPRNKEWQKLYSLSYDIVFGNSLSFSEGNLLSLGFIADTWRIWEWLLSYGISNGVDKSLYSIKLQKSTKYGTRIDENGKTKDVVVIPDIEVYQKGASSPTLLVDAKYKELSSSKGITTSDLYEAIAFCKARSVNRIILAYPEEQSSMNQPGSIRLYYIYDLLGIKVYGVKVGIGTIYSNSDLIIFSKKLSSQILSFLN